MELATEARRVLGRLPRPARLLVESAASIVPRPWLYGRTFRRTQALLARTEHLGADELARLQDARLRHLVTWAYERVPYYRRVLDERGVRPVHVRGAADLELLPLLTREMVRTHAEELLATGVPARAREQVSTGGTSGEPFRFWIDRERSALEWAFMTWQWRRVGYRPRGRRAVLRGEALPGHSIHAWRPLLDELVLSTFQLSPATLPRYLAAIRRYRPAFLHAYPSSAEMLARLLEGVAAADRPRFSALLLSSENLYPAQRERLARAFDCPVLAWYGHSEKCLLGGGCEQSSDYHFFPEYGVAEVVDDTGRRVPPGATGTLVGTGFVNHVMPFLRYVTDDRATRAEGPCRCGRAYARVTAIEGRWAGERLYGTDGRAFTMTALNTHSPAFDRVLRFRIRQEHAGEATVLVVPGPGFGDDDAAGIAAEYGRRAAGSIRFHVETVDSLPLTARGKFRFVDQRIESTPA